MIGYSQNLIKANARADKKLLGVQLGKVCIQKNVSVMDVAKKFGVSRTAVYAWFVGESEVAFSRRVRVSDYLNYLKAA